MIKSQECKVGAGFDDEKVHVNDLLNDGDSACVDGLLQVLFQPEGLLLLL